MKKLFALLIITLFIGLKANAQHQQTYFSPAAPDTSTSLSFRRHLSDSLNSKFYLGVGTNRFWQFYTATQINSLLGTVLPSQTGNSGKYLTTNGTIASWATITGGVSSVGSGYGLLGGPIISTGTLVVDTNKIGLANDMILSGMVTTVSGTTATTTSGTYRLNGMVYTISSTNTTIPAADATLSRFSVIYGNTSGALAVTNGTLSANPDVPTIPANTLLVSTILITPTGTTTTGGSGKISANNGLTLKNGTIQLGGSLLHTTTINFSSSSPFSFVDSGNGSTMSVNSSGFNTNWVNGGNTTQFISGQIQNLMTISNGSNQTGFNTDYVLGNRILDGIFNRGITFAANYTTNQRLQRLSVPSVNTVIALADSVKGTISVATGANPTATAGTSFVNGTATTFMRSDAAPKVDSTVFRTVANSYSLSALQTKFNGYVPTSTTITINGTTFDLSANRSWTVGSSVTPVSGETPSGTINGTNPTFTIAHTPVSGSISVYINGLMERPTTDWTISGTTITMIDIPKTGDNLMVNYQY